MNADNMGEIRLGWFSCPGFYGNLQASIHAYEFYKKSLGTPNILLSQRNGRKIQKSPPIPSIFLELFFIF
ncbi:MAG: hypothetical protein JXR63_11490 [Spirochaetales bacterium]|nr:hypothetical protein [Spirochaetales bacterium]